MIYSHTLMTLLFLGESEILSEKSDEITASINLVFGFFID